MKTLFWNIGKKLSDEKLNLIEEAISSESPDIFCVAEGSHSKINCQKIMDVFEKSGYSCYYSPLFYLNEKLKLNYKYKSNGLKIFIKDENISNTPFSFSLQRQDGRIIALKTFVNFLPTTFIFLHNMSKSGNREVTLEQTEFIGSLSDMLKIGNPSSATERIIIIGDFNLEPWDNVLRHKKYLSTNFFRIHNSIIQRSENTKNFFNPLAELIFKSNNENLGGTYYSDSSGWALFDYVLFDTKESDITYEIITEFSGGSRLLNYDTEINKSFLHNDLDHLPITTKFNS